MRTFITTFHLSPGQSISSADGWFNLYMQTDGNFVLYGRSGALWSSGTSGAGNFAQMQGDGNLVAYNSSSQSVWNSGTPGAIGSFVALQNDGNLVIYDMGFRPVWASSTGGH